VSEPKPVRRVSSAWLYDAKRPAWRVPGAAGECRRDVWKAPKQPSRQRDPDALHAALVALLTTQGPMSINAARAALSTSHRFLAAVVQASADVAADTVAVGPHQTRRMLRLRKAATP
jgi:hypothetical protein